jgi:hypothetical protein
MNNIKVTVKTTVYNKNVIVSESSTSYTERNTGDLAETTIKMYKNLLDYYTPLSQNKATSFACKDSYNAAFEYGACVCSVLHILGDVSIWFQMLESVEYTK